ncbi:hypothetical protein [Spirosoma sp.]|uniref:hypothetical protein n=1 Tax=Spirosoma sp. TaxID=1899569 RepID=UPI00262AE4B7|nr:hypothetical protein [Spirosoma sp.]MCX6216324.1 hypothetical protein [Spirosoma sp.]
MSSKTQASPIAKRSRSFYGLLALLGLLSVGGFQGGWHLMAEPSGHWLAVSPILFNQWIGDFFLPGLYIFIFFGFAPIFLSYAMLTRLRWPLAEMIFGDKDYHWAWLATVGLATLLLLWTLGLIWLVGFRTLYQVLDALMGLMILRLLFLPSIRRSLN